MRDVTSIVLQYRDLVQRLWNTNCWSQPDLRNLDTMHSFQMLRHPLFMLFVWDRIDSGLPPPASIFGPRFRVLPQAAPLNGKRAIRNLLVDTPSSGGAPGNWLELKAEFEESDLQLHLVDFFDWRLFYWRDYRYFRVKIDAFASHPEKVGCQALVDSLAADVAFKYADE